MAKLEKKPKTRCKCTGIFSGSEGITIILFKICSKLSVMNIYYFIQLEKGKQILFRKRVPVDLFKTRLPQTFNM